MLVLSNMTLEPLNVSKKIREPPNVTKVWSYVILVLSNVTIEPLNMMFWLLSTILPKKWGTVELCINKL